MIAKFFWISVLSAISIIISACVNVPIAPPSASNNADATQPASNPNTTSPAKSESTATPEAVKLEPAPQTEPDIPAKTKTTAPFQDLEPLFNSPQQARAYQDSLYRLLLGEMNIKQGNYKDSTEYFLQVAELSRQADIAERATQIALFSKNMEKTEQAVRLWLELTPSNLEARQILTVALLRLGKSVEAAQQIEIILEQEGSSIGSSSETLVSLLKQSGNHDTALQVLEALVQRRSQDTHLLYLYARLLMGAEKIPEAVEQLELLLALQPSHEEAVPLYVRLQHQQGNTQQTLSFLQKQLTLFPEREDWRLIYARLLINAEQGAEAKEQFKKLLIQKPKDTELLYTLGLLSLQNEQPEDAKVYFQQLLNLTEENAEQRNTVRYFLGQAAEQAKHIVEALKWYQDIDEGQYYFSANARIVMLYLEEKNFAQALVAFKEIVPATPDEEFKLLQLEAEIYSSEGRYEDAFAIYQRGLERSPDNIELLYTQGMLAEKIDKLDVLETNFRRILEIEPNHVDTLNALGYTLADRTERYEEALDLVQRAYAKRPNAHYILDSMGWVMYRLQRYDEAIVFLRKALAIQEDPEIAAHLGEVLWQIGKKEEARALWTNIRAKFPDDMILQKTMQKFLQTP